MKLKFSWQETQVGLSPVCASDATETGGISPISCLLMDDGGVGFARLIEWIDRGLEIASSVMSGVEGYGQWDREDWGANIGAKFTEVYSLHDEGCAESLETDSFRRALSAWRNFIISPSGTDVIFEANF